jgi:hypothetical protein
MNQASLRLGGYDGRIHNFWFNFGLIFVRHFRCYGRPLHSQGEQRPMFCSDYH